MSDITYSYANCIDDIDEDWINNASDEDITNCFNDMVAAGVLPSALKEVTDLELQTFWLLYYLGDENTRYPYHVEDVNSYNHFCDEQSKHYTDYSDPYEALGDTPF